MLRINPPSRTNWTAKNHGSVGGITALGIESQVLKYIARLICAKCCATAHANYFFSGLGLRRINDRVKGP